MARPFLSRTGGREIPKNREATKIMKMSRKDKTISLTHCAATRETFGGLDSRNVRSS